MADPSVVRSQVELSGPGFDGEPRYRDATMSLVDRRLFLSEGEQGLISVAI